MCTTLSTCSQCSKTTGPFLTVLASDLLFDAGRTGSGAAASPAPRVSVEVNEKNGSQDRM